jgi:hypothetical protein
MRLNRTRRENHPWWVNLSPNECPSDLNTLDYAVIQRGLCMDLFECLYLFLLTLIPKFLDLISDIVKKAQKKSRRNMTYDMAYPQYAIESSTKELVFLLLLGHVIHTYHPR